MKNYIGLFIIALSLGLTSCNDYLDTLPDDRTELDMENKIAQILVSAYPDNSADYMMELSSDNVQDNGAQFKCEEYQTSMYRWEPILTISWESAQWVWRSHYSAVAVANEALAGLEKLGNPAHLNGCRAEALHRAGGALCHKRRPAVVGVDPGRTAL